MKVLLGFPLPVHLLLYSVSCTSLILNAIFIIINMNDDAQDVVTAQILVHFLQKIISYGVSMANCDHHYELFCTTSCSALCECSLIGWSQIWCKCKPCDDEKQHSCVYFLSNTSNAGDGANSHVLATLYIISTSRLTACLFAFCTLVSACCVT